MSVTGTLTCWYPADGVGTPKSVVCVGVCVGIVGGGGGGVGVGVDGGRGGGGGVGVDGGGDGGGVGVDGGVGVGGGVVASGPVGAGIDGSSNVPVQTFPLSTQHPITLLLPGCVTQIILHPHILQTIETWSQFERLTQANSSCHLRKFRSAMELGKGRIVKGKDEPPQQTDGTGQQLSSHTSHPGMQSRENKRPRIIAFLCACFTVGMSSWKPLTNNEGRRVNVTSSSTTSENRGIVDVARWLSSVQAGMEGFIHPGWPGILHMCPSPSLCSVGRAAKHGLKSKSTC